MMLQTERVSKPSERNTKKLSAMFQGKEERWCICNIWEGERWHLQCFRGRERAFVRLQREQEGICDASGAKGVRLMFQGKEGCLQSFRGCGRISTMLQVVLVCKSSKACSIFVLLLKF